MHTISIDIETYSSNDLNKCGVYKYVQAPDFDILLFGYAVDGGAVQVLDWDRSVLHVVVSAVSWWHGKRWLLLRNIVLQLNVR